MGKENPYENLLTTTEVAERLSVCTSRVRQLLRSGTLNGHRLPAGLWLISEKDISEFNKHRRKAGRPRKE